MDTDVEIRVLRDGVLVQKGRTRIQKGEDVRRIPELASEPGLHRYDVEITALDPAADGSQEDNTGSAFVKVRGPTIALVLDGDGKGAPMKSGDHPLAEVIAIGERIRAVGPGGERRLTRLGARAPRFARTRERWCGPRRRRRRADRDRAQCTCGRARCAGPPSLEARALGLG